jgi:hypothetical protein
LIATLLITILTESVIALGYCIWRRKPIFPILFTSVGANLITQFFLWEILNLFFQHYLAILLVAELCIWGIESLMLYSIPANQLNFGEAVSLSLSMNLASLGIGWFLAI